MENEGAVANSILSPNHSTAAENPSHHSDPSTSELAHLLVVPSTTPPSSEMINPRKAWPTSRSTLCHSSRMAWRWRIGHDLHEERSSSAVTLPTGMKSMPLLLFILPLSRIICMMPWMKWQNILRKSIVSEFYQVVCLRLGCA